MFTHNPELKEIFNMSNQRMAINVKHCLTLLPPTPVILKPACAAASGRKNRAEAHQLPDKPEQYNIVGEHLLATLDEMSARGRKCWTRGVKPMVYWLMIYQSRGGNL